MRRSGVERCLSLLLIMLELVGYGSGNISLSCRVCGVGIGIMFGRVGGVDIYGVD
jgi:hypothetical protein